MLMFADWTNIIENHQSGDKNDGLRRALQFRHIKTERTGNEENDGRKEVGMYIRLDVIKKQTSEGNGEQAKINNGTQ